MLIWGAKVVILYFREVMYTVLLYKRDNKKVNFRTFYHQERISTFQSDHDNCKETKVTLISSSVKFHYKEYGKDIDSV